MRLPPYRLACLTGCKRQARPVLMESHPQGQAGRRRGTASMDLPAGGSLQVQPRGDAMTSVPTKLRLGTAPVAQAEALKRTLAAHDIEVALIHNEVTCTSGCSLTVEIWAHPDD